MMRPAMLRAAERADEVIFAATVKSALPDPEPLLLVAMTQTAVLEDVQEQPAPAVTVIARLPPAIDIDGAVGETVKEHDPPSGGGGGVVDVTPWLTTNACGPINSSAYRLIPVAFGSTV